MRWRGAASRSATRRCGPTTIRRPAASRRSPCSPRPPPRPDVGVAVLALDRHAPPDVAAQSSPRSGSRPTRLWLGIGAGLHEAPARRRARGARGAAGGPSAGRADRRRRDGAQDVRARGRRGRRRVPELDDARRRPPGRASGCTRAPPRPAGRSRRPCSATCASPSATTRRSACARRSRSTGSCTRATSATSRRSARRRARSASRRAIRPRSTQRLAEYDAIDHVVVRALAHADADSLGEVAEAAAP